MAIVTKLYVYLFTTLIYGVSEIGSSQNIEYSHDEEAPNNFGVVVKNSYHTIYRSARLGNSGLENVAEHLERKGLPFPKTVIHMNKHGFKRRLPLNSLFALEEYKAQNKYDFQYFHSYRSDYRTYLDGKNPYEASQDIDKKKYLNKEAQKYFTLDDREEADGNVDDMIRILELVLNNDEPVLFHCTGGRHRTGMIALAIRYMQGGEWINGPKKEAGTGVFGKKRELNPAQYEYWLHNKRLFRIKNIEFMEEFSKDQRFLALKETYAHSLNSDISTP